MAQSNDIKMDDSLKFRSEIKALGFMQLKKYVKAIGAPTPDHITKGNLLRAIWDSKKFKEDPPEKEDIGASPSTIEVKKAASPRARADDAFNEKAFLSGSQGNGSKLSKRFRGHFNADDANKLIRPLQNVIFACDMKVDRLEEAITKCEVKEFGSDFIMRIYETLSKVSINDWTTACAASYELDKNVDEKYKRFFRFVAIPQIRDRMIALGDLVALQDSLNQEHQHTHHVHSALHEIVYNEELVRYLIGVLLFIRAKRTQGINLSGLKINWGSENNAILLLRTLIQQLHVTPQDFWLAEKFDEINEAKPRVRKTDMGTIIKHHFQKVDGTENGAVEILETQVNPPPPPASLNSVMAELSSKVTVIEPVNFALRSRQTLEAAAKVEQIDEHEHNLKRLEFRVPQFRILGKKRQLERIQQQCAMAGLGSHDEYIKELFVSYERLVTTNDNVLELWSRAESNYFEALRMEYLKRIKDPQFLVICDFVEEKWDLFLPDTVWGCIWEFRAPYEQRVDLRFALEVLKDFLENHWPENSIIV